MQASQLLGEHRSERQDPLPVVGHQRGDHEGPDGSHDRAAREAPGVARDAQRRRELLGDAPLERGSAGLRHIAVLQGTKAYGVHQGPSKTPAKESDPRYLPPNFYYAQEDFLREAGNAIAHEAYFNTGKYQLYPVTGNPRSSALYRQLF